MVYNSDLLQYLVFCCLFGIVTPVYISVLLQVWKIFDGIGEERNHPGEANQVVTALETACKKEAIFSTVLVWLRSQRQSCVVAAPRFSFTALRHPTLATAIYCCGTGPGHGERGGVRTPVHAGARARHHGHQHLPRLHRLLELHVRALGLRSLLHTN